MPGKEARDGFWFQDAKALARLLEDAVERRRRRVLGEALGPELRVRVESAVELGVGDAVQIAPVPPRPAWDGTFVMGDRIVVDECKLSGPDRDERVTFYRRLRATIADNVPVDRLVPRITASRTTMPERWHQLARAAERVEPATEPFDRVDTAEQLAAEALYYLTVAEPRWTLKKEADSSDTNPKRRRAVVITPPALSLEQARSLIGRFELDDAATEEELELQLRGQLESLLVSDFAVDDVIDMLRGWIDRIARERDLEDDLTADTLGERLTALQRYLQVPAAVESLWHRLRETTPALPPTHLAVQPWRDVQPALDEALRVRTATRVVFTSEGGVGKSFLLAALHGEQPGTRVWIDAVAPLQDLEQALSLGAWASQRKGVELTVFVEAIEQVTDSRSLLGAIDRALGAYARATVFVAARFATWAQIREAFPRWLSLRLERWSPERIRAIAQARRTQPLSADLVDLLRTPLLLDLFLRAFGEEEAVPHGLATRHGVLRAYFERRILPDDDPRASDRRTILDAGVAAVLANTATWRVGTQAAHDLVSEGVLTRVFGELRFRHALLRDFASALQLCKRTAAQVAQALAAVESPIIRSELMRGVIEALLDPQPAINGPTVAGVVGECSRSELTPGVALGTTDAPTAALLSAIAPLEDGAVLRQAVVHAQTIDNRAWLRVASTLGGERPAWLGPTQIEAMGKLAEFAATTGDSAGIALAQTLRTWTRGHVVGQEGPRPIALIGRLLACRLIEDETVAWYASLRVGELNFLSPFLEPLRDLGAQQHLDEQLLYRALSMVIFESGAHVLQGGHSLWEVIHLCMVEHDEDEGLLTTRPSLGLSLLFALSVACKEEEVRRRRPMPADEDLARFLASLPVEQELVDAEARLRRLPRLTEQEAIGDLVDDIHRASFALDEVESVLDEVARRSSTDVEFAQVVAERAIASRSMHARTIALALPRAPQVDTLVEVILRDSRVYHFRRATQILWDAIHSRWENLGADTAAAVQRNILMRASSPLLAISEVGQLASAIPRTDLHIDLVRFVEFLETTDRSTTPLRSGAMGISGSGVDPDDEHPVEAGTPQPVISNWRRLEQLANRNDEAAATQSVELLRELLASDGVGDQTPEWAWFAISRLVGEDYRREQKLLTVAEAAILFEASMTQAVRADRRDDAEFWGTLIDVADGCLAYDNGDVVRAWRRRVVEEIVATAGERAQRPAHAWRAVLLAGATLIDAESGGRALFGAWFRDHLHGDGLQAGLRRLQGFAPAERVEMLGHVLETDGRFQNNKTAQAFAGDAGKDFGAWSIGWDESFARDRFRRWCNDGRTGALTHDHVWRTFLSGFAWLLQDQVRRATPGPRTIEPLARFVPLLTDAWSAWSRIIDDGAEGNISVGWSVLRPISRRYSTRLTSPDGAWSISLRPLVSRVITEGSRNDIAALQDVAWAELDEQTLAPAAHALIARADGEIAHRPAGDWIIDSLIDALGAIGVVATLPDTQANRVLACLQRLGRSVSRATTVAVTVEREIRQRILGGA